VACFDGKFYFVEANGRPNRAYKYLPPIVEAPRISACQTAVGQWGDAEVPSNDYDGGHMLGSQLGGYGGRINLVPQDLNFNRGNWAQVENKAADCGALPDERIFYYVRADYDDSTSLVPATMSLTLENRDTEDSVSFEFQNADGGGADGTSQRIEAVSFLDDRRSGLQLTRKISASRGLAQGCEREGFAQTEGQWHDAKS
jgi:hypothetical protein